MSRKWSRLLRFVAILGLAVLGLGPAGSGASANARGHEQAFEEPAPKSNVAVAHDDLAPLSPFTNFSFGSHDPKVLTLRRLLVRAGFDTPGDQSSTLYDLPLLRTVRAFQLARKLKPTGVARERTIGLLNEILLLRPAVVSKPPSAASFTPEHRGRTTSAGMPDLAQSAKDAELPTLDAGSVQRMEGALTRFIEMKHRADANPSVASETGENKVRERLRSEGFLPATYKSGENRESELRDALRKWQNAYGLAPTGEVDTATMRAMRVSIEQRILELESSISRARVLTARLPAFFVVVNIADAKLQVVEDGKVSASLPVIAGKGSRQTPEFVTEIPYIQLAPTWTVPRSIVRKDIAPRVRSNRAYLAQHNLRAVVGNRTVNPRSVNWLRGPFPTLVQRPGSGNALGLVRFGMARGGTYYIHGTSEPRALKRGLRRRFVSSGCVRVADAIALASILANHSGPGFSPTRIRELISEHDGGWRPGARIELQEPVLVVWTYMTSWTTPDGITHFRDDVYGRNRQKPASELAQQNEGE